MAAEEPKQSGRRSVEVVRVEESDADGGSSAVRCRMHRVRSSGWREGSEDRVGQRPGAERKSTDRGAPGGRPVGRKPANRAVSAGRDKVGR